ncbi:hypothetical protein ACFCX3_33115, partial [Streptomyces virginiae]
MWPKKTGPGRAMAVQRPSGTAAAPATGATSDPATPASRAGEAAVRPPEARRPPQGLTEAPGSC